MFSSHGGIVKLFWHIFMIFQSVFLLFFPTPSYCSMIKEFRSNFYLYEFSALVPIRYFLFRIDSKNAQVPFDILRALQPYAWTFCSSSLEKFNFRQVCIAYKQVICVVFEILCPWRRVPWRIFYRCFGGNALKFGILYPAGSSETSVNLTGKAHLHNYRRKKFKHHKYFAN
jgi:hypothetical protein